MRNLLLIIFFPFVLLFSVTKTMACVDSITYQMEPVACFGQRDGKIKISQVHGGVAPYYFSIDGQSYSTNPNFDHLWAGDILLSIRDASGCILSVSVKVTQPKELVARILASDTALVPGKQLTLQGVYDPETAILQSVKWTPTELFSRQDTLRQQIIITKSSKIGLELYDHKGCNARDEITIEVTDPHIYAPNALRPGSIDNAYFTLFAGEGVDKLEYLRVFDRTGALLFEQTNFTPNDPSKGWNGRSNGKTVQPGVYVWIASIKYLDGSFENREGTITVVE